MQSGFQQNLWLWTLLRSPLNGLGLQCRFGVDDARYDLRWVYRISSELSNLPALSNGYLFEFILNNEPAIANGLLLFSFFLAVVGALTFTRLFLELGINFPPADLMIKGASYFCLLGGVAAIFGLQHVDRSCGTNRRGIPGADLNRWRACLASGAQLRPALCCRMVVFSFGMYHLWS